MIIGANLMLFVIVFLGGATALWMGFTLKNVLLSPFRLPGRVWTWWSTREVRAELLEQERLKTEILKEQLLNERIRSGLMDGAPVKGKSARSRDDSV